MIEMEPKVMKKRLEGGLYARFDAKIRWGIEGIVIAEWTDRWGGCTGLGKNDFSFIV